MNNVAAVLPLPPVYYHARETSYWRMDENNRWIKVNDASAKSFIAEHAYSKCPPSPCFWRESIAASKIVSVIRV